MKTSASVALAILAVTTVGAVYACIGEKAYQDQLISGLNEGLQLKSNGNIGEI